MSDLVGTKGGSGVWQRIVSEVPAHDVWMEPFWGRGTIAKAMRRSSIVVGCDTDPDGVADAAEFGALTWEGCGVKFVEGYFGLRRVGEGLHRRLGGGVSALGEAVGFGGVPWDRHVVYFDPPYLDVPHYYLSRWGGRDHERLLSLFRAMPCGAMLSGYESELYCDSLADVRCVRIPTVNRAGKRVTEMLWCNFAAGVPLHDPRFVGRGRRERQRIRRRCARWAAVFRGLPASERQAVREAIDGVPGVGSGE